MHLHTFALLNELKIINKTLDIKICPTIYVVPNLKVTESCFINIDQNFIGPKSNVRNNITLFVECLLTVHTNAEVYK